MDIDNQHAQALSEKYYQRDYSSPEIIPSERLFLFVFSQLSRCRAALVTSYMSRKLLNL